MYVKSKSKRTSQLRSNVLKALSIIITLIAFTMPDICFSGKIDGGGNRGSQGGGNKGGPGAGNKGGQGGGNQGHGSQRDGGKGSDGGFGRLRKRWRW